MNLARYRSLVIDVTDPDVMGPWLAERTGLTYQRTSAEAGKLTGPDPRHDVWLCVVPEAKTVKNRVHLDLIAPDLTAFADCRRLSSPGEFPWTVFADPEGGEFCVFVRDDETARLKDVVVDSHDSAAIAEWWADIFGGDWDEDEGDAWIDDVPNCPFESVDFVDVPEGKQVKNRLHWDVDLAPGAAIADLESRGASVLAEHEHWTVLADPQGNEFCAFPASS